MKEPDQVDGQSQAAHGLRAMRSVESFEMIPESDLNTDEDDSGRFFVVRKKNNGKMVDDMVVVEDNAEKKRILEDGVEK